MPRNPGDFRFAGVDGRGRQSLVRDPRGGGPAVQAFAGGGVDLCICAADHVVRLVNRRFDARIIVGLDEHHSYALLGKANAPYADVKSLKGKRIGVTSPGALTDNTVRWAITRAGLRPERDFQIVAAGGGAADVAGTHQQTVARHFGIARVLAECAQEQRGETEHRRPHWSDGRVGR